MNQYTWKGGGGFSLEVSAGLMAYMYIQFHCYHTPFQKGPDIVATKHTQPIWLCNQLVKHMPLIHTGHAHRSAGEQHLMTLCCFTQMPHKSERLLVKSVRLGGNLKSKVNPEDLPLNWETWSLCMTTMVLPPHAPVLVMFCLVKLYVRMLLTITYSNGLYFLLYYAEVFMWEGKGLATPGNQPGYYSRPNHQSVVTVVATWVVIL